MDETVDIPDNFKSIDEDVKLRKTSYKYKQSNKRRTPENVKHTKTRIEKTPNKSSTSFETPNPIKDSDMSKGATPNRRRKSRSVTPSERRRSGEPISRKRSRASKNASPSFRKDSRQNSKNTTPVPRKGSRASKNNTPNWRKKPKDASFVAGDESALTSKSSIRIGGSSLSIVVEQSLVDTLKKMLEAKEWEVPHGMSDLELNRWLRQKKSNLQKAVDGIEAHVEWRKEMNIEGLMKEPLEEDIQKQKDSHVFLILSDQTLDPSGRPIIICSPIKHLNKCQMGTVDVKRFIIYYQETMSIILDRLNSLNFTAFLDLKGCKMKHVDYGMAKEMGQLIRSHYPERLGKLYVINYPYFYHVIWYVVKTWISKKTQSKIKFLDSKKIDIKSAIENEKIPDTFVWK